MGLEKFQLATFVIYPYLLKNRFIEKVLLIVLKINLFNNKFNKYNYFDSNVLWKSQ